MVVSIHAPRAGRDKAPGTRVQVLFEFQSTRPARGATDQRIEMLIEISFNPRAPRGARRLNWCRRSGRKRFNPRAPRGARREYSGPGSGGDCFNPRAPRGARRSARLTASMRICFNPRAPRGARHLHQDRLGLPVWFQSTRPARGATGAYLDGRREHVVSIHAPRAGRDPRCAPADRAGDCFNPRAPRGARLAGRDGFQAATGVSIHAPRAGRDFRCA